MDELTAGSDAGARGANCTVRVMSPLMIHGERHEIGAFVHLPEDQAEELVALGVVEVVPVAPLVQGGTGKGDPHEIGAFVQMPEDQAEELVGLGVVEIMPEMPQPEGGKKKKPA